MCESTKEKKKKIPPPPPNECAVALPVLRIRIHLMGIWIQHFRLNADPDPGFR
jgi:hypothetical protein